MSDLNTQALELAQAQLANHKKLQPSDATEIPAPACAVGDKDCINRWVQAFSDCD